MSIGNEFLTSIIKRLNYYKELGDKTFEQLSESDFHYQPNEASNSIAVNIQHMAGNMLSRWAEFLTTDGEKEWRQRDEEFEEQHLSKAALIALWEKGWGCMMNTLKGLVEDDLLKTIYIRGEGLSALDAINRQLAHYPYHVGQIIYIARIIRNEDWISLSIPKRSSDRINGK